MSELLATVQRRGARVAPGVAAVALFLLLPSFAEDPAMSADMALWQRPPEILAYVDAPRNQAIVDQLRGIIDEYRQASAAGFPRQYAIVDDVALLMPRDADLPVQYLLYQPAPYFEYALEPRRESLAPV